MRIPRTAVVMCLLILASAALVAAGCSKPANGFGMVQGGVTISPVFPGPQPSGGENRPVPPDVFSARKVVIYDLAGKSLVKTVDIHQIGQGATGYYAVQLKPGTYIVDIGKNGIDHAPQVPKTVIVIADKAVFVDIDINTGIR